MKKLPDPSPPNWISTNPMESIERTLAEIIREAETASEAYEKAKASGIDITTFEINDLFEEYWSRFREY